ncbi:MAG: hypothetical protein DI539_24500 [Flavobacterium psychrophilum]|jgi:hypothetical protein|uniref:hypothetical protein n=1 Tax=Chitinophaga TaxID=79328 RepID=UPI00092CCE47|nr:MULTISPECIES: hypothetical protein [Chitinophaga]MCH5689546.1 hypothetical protein [Niabella sp. W65]OJW42328.1 MAG: hypothetical protein BGO56_10875 [Sphingobacteriales bacterium 48-107]PZR06330.1 MAG: hypothetical protein DI539_24500 [Flavobacterium psychrophilum]ASZ09621.1 hypothetical protein CK934_00830 [Chitinophaga sp. MD30]MCH7368049.1 hypothetical protein [Niabella sp. W65]
MEALIKLLQAMSYPTMVFVGLAIRLFVGMRQFNRRGLGGLQHFNNYLVGLITLAIEWMLKWAALALLLWGLWGWLFR